MSAFIVSNDTVNCLVNALLEERCMDGLRPEECGQRLLDENTRSVNTRYGENSEAPRFVFTRRTYEQNEIHSAIGCWKFQSCETSDYRRTKAWTQIRRLEQMLPSQNQLSWGWQKGHLVYKK